MNEQRTDPVLDRLHAQNAEENRQYEFERLALLAKLERLEARQPVLEQKHKRFFGQKKGWEEKQAKKRKIAANATTAAVTVALSAAVTKLGQDEMREKFHAPKVAPAPKPSKYAPHMTTHVAGNSAAKYVQQPIDSSAIHYFQKDSIEAIAPLGVHEMQVSEPVSQNLDTVAIPAVEFAQPRESEDIAQIETLHSHEMPIPEAAQVRFDTVAVPELPSVRIENETKIDKVSISPVRTMAIPQGQYTVPHTVDVPVFTPPHVADSIAYVTPRKAKKLDEPRIEMPHFKEVQVPELPPIVMDSVVAPAPKPAPAPAVLPEGWKPPRAGETIDSTTTFDFDAIDKESVPKPKAKDKEKKAPADVPDDGKRHSKIKVVNDMDHPNEVAQPHKPSMGPDMTISRRPGVRMDSLYENHAKMIGDTTEAVRYDVSIQPGMEKFLHSNGDTVKTDTLKNGVIVAETFNGHGFKLGEHKTERMRDLEKRPIKGGFIVPEILKYRIDENAWEKLQAHDLRVQELYLKRVESKENIGPWVIADKTTGTLLVFNEDNTLRAEAPFLFGASEGEELNTYMTEGNTEGRTTSPGMYIALRADAKAKKGLPFGHDAEKNLWELGLVMPDGTIVNQGTAFHGEISNDVEGQEKDIHSTDGRLHEKTLGCIRVDWTALQKIFTDERYVIFVMPRDATLSYDYATGALVRRTEAQVRKNMNDEVQNFWTENLVLYNLETEEVKKGKNNVAEQVSTYVRDRHADERIVAVKNTKIAKMKIPRIIKRK